MQQIADIQGSDYSHKYTSFILTIPTILPLSGSIPWIIKVFVQQGPLDEDPGNGVVHAVVAERLIDLRTILTKDDEKLFFVIALSQWNPNLGRSTDSWSRDDRIFQIGD